MACELALASGHRRDLGRLEVDAILLPTFEVKAQPRNVAGHVDWRLCGRIARLLLAETFSGRPSEALLMPAMGRLGAQRLFLYGLGRPAAPKEPHVKERLAESVKMLVEAGATDVAVGFPAAPSFLAESDDALDADLALQFIDVLGGAGLERVRLLQAGHSLQPHRETLARFAKDKGLSWMTT